MGKKKAVQICNVHPGVKNAQDLYDDFRIHPDDLEYEFIWNDETPDYLVASSVLYEDWKVWESFKRLYSRAKICIFHSGECEAPDLNIFDYAICYNAHLQEDDRIFRLPSRFFHQDKIFRMKNDLENEPGKACKELLRKKMFCNFIYSNANGAEERTEIFKAVTLYKRVDSLGAYLNNTSVCKKPSTGDNWSSIIAESIEMKRNYKFSIAFENALFPGYTSEKLFSSLEAHTIPIYWGNPYIEEEVNEDAIINCHKFTSFAEVVERIREVDSDDAMWCRMVSEPWLTEKQIALEKEKIEQYSLFLNNIFMQPIHQARRRGKGSCPSRYEDWFFAETHGRYLLEQTRDRKNYSACARWLEKVYAGEKIDNYFKQNGWSRIAVYGMSAMGRVLVQALADTDIVVVYAIDQGNADAKNIPVYHLENVPKNEPVDAVVVMLPHLYEQIAKEIKKHSIPGTVVSIEKVLEYKD